METINQPSKEQIRDWLKRRQVKANPPPDIEQIRRELGWRLTGKARALTGNLRQA